MSKERYINLSDKQVKDTQNQSQDFMSINTICRRLNQQDQKINDLEAKLAESEDLLESLGLKSIKALDELLDLRFEITLGHITEIQELKQQLEESEAYIQGNIPKLIEANKMMSKQLAEKEKEIDNLYNRLNSKQKFYEMSLEKDYKEYLSRLDKLEKKCDKDKILFAIEQLEKVKNEIYANEVSFEEIAKLPIALNNYEMGFDKGRFKAVHIIDNQIKQLKEMK